MKRFYLTQEQFNNKIIDGEEYNHLKNVMRMREGDEFFAFFGGEFDYLCELIELKKNYASFKIINEQKNNKNPNIKIDLFQALAKGEKMELVAQKCTEIGFSTFIPLFVKNCDVKPNTTRVDRLNKIIVSACKQCGRSTIPTVCNCVNLKECITLLSAYDLVLFANETEDSNRIYDTLNKNLSAKNVALIVGPEGGFTTEEIEEIKNKAVSITFGKRILRTETASIYLTSIVNDFYRN